MNERIAAFLVWGLVGLSVGTYALKLWPRSAGMVAPMPGAERTGPASLDRLLGPAAPEAAAPSLPADSRFQLMGLVAARDPARQGVEGLAVLSLDGQPPRAVRVGQRLDAEWQLMRVEPHGAQLGRGGVAQVQLRLEPPAAAVPGSLPPPPTLIPVAPEPAPPVAAPPAPIAAQIAPQPMAPVTPVTPGAANGASGDSAQAAPASADSRPGRRHDPKARL